MFPPNFSLRKLPTAEIDSLIEFRKSGLGFAGEIEQIACFKCVATLSFAAELQLYIHSDDAQTPY